jgi:hypothetical protein
MRPWWPARPTVTGSALKPATRRALDNRAPARQCAGTVPFGPVRWNHAERHLLARHAANRNKCSGRREGSSRICTGRRDAQSRPESAVACSQGVDRDCAGDVEVEASIRPVQVPGSRQAPCTVGPGGSADLCARPGGLPSLARHRTAPDLTHLGGLMIRGGAGGVASGAPAKALNCASETLCGSGRP